MRYLTSEDVISLLSMDKAIDLMRDAFADLCSGDAVVPVRTNLSVGSRRQNQLLVMPAGLPRFGAGLKVISVAPENREKGLPTSCAVVIVLNPETGEIDAIIEAEALTAIRTGAGSGLATDILAPPDAAAVAIFGAGSQAETQLEAVCTVRPIKHAIVFNRTLERAEDYARRMSAKLGITVSIGGSPEELKKADVICTATASLSPLFRGVDISDRVHINAVGSYRFDMVEVPPDVVERATVVADHKPACLAEAGDLLQPMKSGLIDESHIVADLAELMTGARLDAQQPVTLFKSVGVACQDVAVGNYLAAVAAERNLGMQLPSGH